MTDEEIRRIRRITVGDAPTELPRPVDPRHEERFRRALGGPRRAVASPIAAMEPAAAAPPPWHQEPTHDAMPQERPTRPHHPSPREHSTTRPSASTARPSPASSSSARPTATQTDTFSRTMARPLTAPSAAGSASARAAEEQTVDGSDEIDDVDAVVVPPPMPVAPVMETLPPDAWADGVAHTVAALCHGSEPSFHSWTIQVPLDGEALPHTELRMTFSRHHLQLRFSTASTRSFHLISAHQAQLRALLVRALPGDRHIDIELT